MKWKINYSKQSIKFIEKHKLHNEVLTEIKKTLSKLIENENMNLN